MTPKTEDLTGPGRRGRHAGHRGQGADGARAGRGPAPARRRHSLRHHQRSAAAGAWPCCSTRCSSKRRSRASTVGCSSSGICRSSKQKTLPPDVAAKAIELIRDHGLDAWVYRGNDWLITKLDAPHVAREAWTVKFEPKVVADFADMLDEVAKIVGVSDDHDKVQRCEADAQAAFGQRATASRSQPYYLDVTHKEANKGAVVDYLSRSSGHPGRGDRHHRRPAERRADVQAIGLQHRHGQCLRSGQGAGQCHDGFLQRRGLRQGDGALRSRIVGLRRRYEQDDGTHRGTAGSAVTRAPCR